MTMKNNGYIICHNMKLEELGISKKSPECRKTDKRKLENFSMSVIWDIDISIQNIAAPRCSTMSTTKHNLFQASV